jgi:hypothetical protein
MEKYQEVHILFKDKQEDVYSQGMSFFDCTIADAVKALEDRQEVTKCKLHLIGLYPVYPIYKN